MFEDSFYEESSPSSGKNKRLPSGTLKGSAPKKANSSEHSLEATPKQTAPQPFNTPNHTARLDSTPGPGSQAPPAGGQPLGNMGHVRPPTNISLPPNSMTIQNWPGGNQQAPHLTQGPMVPGNQPPPQQQQPSTPQQASKQPQQGGIQLPQQPMQQQHPMMNQQQMMHQQLMAQQQQMAQQPPQGSMPPSQNGTPSSQQLAFALASQQQMPNPANPQGTPVGGMRGAQGQMPMLTAQQHQFLAQQSMRQHMYIPQGMPQGMPQAMPQGSQMMMQQQQARPNMMRPNMPYQNPNNMSVRPNGNGGMFPNNAYAEHHKTVQMLKMNTGTRPPMMSAQGMMNGDSNMQMHQQMMNSQFQSPTAMMGGMSNSPNQGGTPGHQGSTPKPADATPNPPPSGGLSRGSTPANSGSATNLSFNNIFPSHNSDANTPVSSANTPMSSAPGSQPPANPMPQAQTPTSAANGSQNNPGQAYQMNQFERYVNDGEFMFNFGMVSGAGDSGEESTTNGTNGTNGTGSNPTTSGAGGGGLHPADDLSGSLESIMGMDPFAHSEYF